MINVLYSLEWGSVGVFMIALRSKTVAHTFFLSFDNANGRLCQDPEILLPW